jgi:hypothetical protein
MRKLHAVEVVEDVRHSARSTSKSAVSRSFVARTRTAIESMFATVRSTQRNVKRWRDGDIRLRWTAAGMAEAQRGFRRVKRYRGVPKLIAAIRRSSARPIPSEEPLPSSSPESHIPDRRRSSTANGTSSASRSRFVPVVCLRRWASGRTAPAFLIASPCLTTR